ncbi:diacylglycerol kinase [Burkholderiaceae bacterium DAT-1]|nr:diacylglycerol kinase [Burkholderiaceae bacterium DAT-1]
MQRRFITGLCCLTLSGLLFPITELRAADPPPSAKAQLGQLIFNDPALSASGRQSCASCHSPADAFSQPGSRAAPLGGLRGDLQGPRNTPTAMYAQYIPGFSLNGAIAAPGQIAVTGKAVGGFLMDGRASTLAAQAQLPFITVFEMGNANSTAVLNRLKQRPYVTQLAALYGAATLNGGDATLAALGDAIAAFESQTPQLKPFTSKYDAVIAGKASFTPAEADGLAIFNNASRGNCAACHSSQPSQGVPALFTDHAYRNLGVPRNWDISYNNDTTILPAFIPANGLALGAPNHQYYDMGLCGPFRTDLSGLTSLCGQFKTPTLRNAALKHAYYHNGVFKDLRTVVGFYATRTANPSRWYRRADGSADIVFNDLPTQYRANVVTTIRPFTPAGTATPSLTPADVQNLVSFLCTLTDGFDPSNPAAFVPPAQCR